VVSTGAGANLRLVAFYVSADAFSEPGLRNQLRERLPEYMVPSRLVPIAVLPLTSSGKADRQGLLQLAQQPAAAGEAAAREVAADETGRGNIPGGENSGAQNGTHGASKLSEEIARLWVRELGIAHFDAADHFFNIGGDSLLVIKVALKMKEEFGVEPDFAEFLNQTFAGFVSSYEKKINTSI
jgi:acyl carrier protein